MNNIYRPYQLFSAVDCSSNKKILRKNSNILGKTPFMYILASDLFE